MIHGAVGLKGNLCSASAKLAVPLADRSRYRQQAIEHLQLLELIEHGAQVEAADLLRSHLQGVMEKLSTVRRLLSPEQRTSG